MPRKKRAGSGLGRVSKRARQKKLRGEMKRKRNESNVFCQIAIDTIGRLVLVEMVVMVMVAMAVVVAMEVVVMMEVVMGIMVVMDFRVQVMVVVRVQVVTTIMRALYLRPFLFCDPLPPSSGEIVHVCLAQTSLRVGMTLTIHPLCSLLAP